MFYYVMNQLRTSKESWFYFQTRGHSTENLTNGWVYFSKPSLEIYWWYNDIDEMTFGTLWYNDIERTNRVLFLRPVSFNISQSAKCYIINKSWKQVWFRVLQLEKGVRGWDVVRERKKWLLFTLLCKKPSFLLFWRNIVSSPAAEPAWLGCLFSQDKKQKGDWLLSTPLRI